MENEKQEVKDVADETRKLSGKTWAIIWVVLFIACLAAYPASSITGLIGGWLPVTFVISFGVMFILCIVGTMFAKDIIKGTRKK